MKYEVPIWEKANLTLEEAAAYSGVGINKLRKISDSESCPFVLWIGSKRLLKYNTFVRPNFGRNRISTIKKSEVKRFYNQLADDRQLQASTIDNIHTVLHQVLDMAVYSTMALSTRRFAGSSGIVMMRCYSGEKMIRCCCLISAAIRYGTRLLHGCVRRA